jgi:plasmid maintenance system antidote protein VapI
MISELKHGDQAKLARRVGISLRHMNDIIRGRRKPSYGLAKKFEDATGIKRQAWIWPEDFANPLITLPEVRSQDRLDPIELEGRKAHENDQNH